MNWTVYILFSEKLSRFYTGCTHQLNQRITNHLEHFYGAEAFTAKAKDWVVKLELLCRDEKHAKAVEKHIKSMKSSNYIKNLIQYTELQNKLISRF